jgi:hypothetical protein
VLTSRTNCFSTDDANAGISRSRNNVISQEGCALKAAALLLCRQGWVVAREEWEKSASCINAYYVSQSSWPLLCTHITTALHSATFAFMIGFFYVYRGQHFWSFIIHIGGHHISSTTCTFKVYMHKYIHYVPVNMYTGGAYAGIVGLCVVHNQVECALKCARSNGSMRCREKSCRRNSLVCN